MAANNKKNNMQLTDLLKGLPVTGSKPKVLAKGISLHSNAVIAGDIFFAYAGESGHGIDYIKDAVDRGAVAVVTDENAKVSQIKQQYKEIPIVTIKGLKENLSLIGSRFFSSKTNTKDIFGITGTNGKTSCSHFLAQCYKAEGKSCYVIGTLGNGFYPSLNSAQLTTPDAFHLQALLAQAQDQAADAIVMEVSSHALQQHRADATAFKLAIFTNLSRDHLDYHGDMERYFTAKQRLFHMPGLKYAVLNADDPASQRLESALDATVRVCRYSVNSHHGKAQISARILERGQKGMRLHIESDWGRGDIATQLIGDFNVSNLLAVMASLFCIGWSWQKVVEVVECIHGVPGRLEQLGGGPLPLVIIDYAHTPDAMKQALLAIIAYRGKQGRTIVVFGCGGNRDQGKRGQMGQVAHEYADYIVLTDDNPRDEDSAAILADILKGINLQKKVHMQPDRAMAIRHALFSAVADDVVLIAGKGHESYQLVAGQRLAFSDREQVQQCLQELAA